MLSTRICLCFLVACVYGVVAIDWNPRLATLTIPLFMWSDKQIFSAPNTQQYDTLSKYDVEYALRSIFNVKEESKSSLLETAFNNNAGTPEVVVIFAEPQLRTDQVSSLASAYGNSAGGSFSNLMTSLEKSATSLVAPYASTFRGSTLLDDAILETFYELRSGSVFVTRVGGSSLFARLRVQTTVKTVELNSLMTELKSADVFTNGVTDLVVVCLDKSSYASHDEIIGSIMADISAKGNFVAMYSANEPSDSELVWNFEQHVEVEHLRSLQIYLDTNDTNNCSNNSNNSNCTGPSGGGSNKINYFPGPLVEVYMITAILLAMLFTGGCAIFSLQTPDRWEVPKLKRDL